MQTNQIANQTTRLVVLAAVLLGLVASVAVATEPLPDWAVATDQPIEFSNERPGIKRPAIGAYTNFYTYGPPQFGSSVELYLSIDPAGFDGAVNMFIILENRVSGSAQYYNLSRGWVNAETDLFSAQGGDPVAILPPELDGAQLFGPAGAFGSFDGPTATGQYQLVVELRTAGSNQVVARDNAMYSFVDAAMPLQGNIGSQTLTANNAYVLTGPTFVSGTLTIEPGTFILCTPDSDSVLAIQRGAQIMADGTNKRPIVISSLLEWQDRQPQDCGGVAINGNGTINVAGGEADGEGDSGLYGGNNPNDSSGVLRYVRIEFGGQLYSAQNELNGLALQGTGAGTVVEYVMISYGGDDGLEHFGGNTNTKYIISYNNQDDGYDATEGWSGEAQFVCVIHTVTNTNTGFEIDGNSDNVNAVPATEGKFTNFTIVSTGSNSDQHDSMVFRVGAKYDLTNGAISNQGGRKAIALGDSDEPGDPTPGFPGTANGQVTNVFFENGVAGDDPAIASANLPLADPRNRTKPDIRFRSGNVGNQGCVTRANPWVYWDWTEFQPGPSV